MKKTVIITALVMVASFVALICFGVAIGSNEVRNYWKSGSSSFSDAVKNIGNNAGEYDWGITKKEQYLKETQAIEGYVPAEDNTDLTIHADVAEIYIDASSDNCVHTKADIYSYSDNYNRARYKLTSGEYDIDLQASSDVNNNNCVAVLTVSIPDAIKSITVTSDVGDIEISGIQLESLKANVSVGQLEVKNCITETANIKVDTGNVDLSDSFVYSKSLDADVDIGSIDMSLPNAKSFVISYNTSMGSIDFDDDINTSKFKFYDKNGSNLDNVSAEGKVVFNPGSLNDDELVKINLNASMGSISIG